jgi:O-antigen/teichoic acid export membrane protein
VGEIRKQGITNSIITYAGILIGFLNIVIIQPNFLSPEELGLTRILFSFSALLATIMPLGLGNITIKFFPLLKNSENRNNGYFGFLLLMGTAGFIITSSILLFLKPFVLSHFVDQSPMLAEFFVMIFPLMFFLGFNTLLSIYSFSLFKTSVPSLLNEVIIRFGSIVIVSAYFMKWLSLDSFILLFVFIYGIQSLFLVLYIFLIDKPGFKINFPRFREVGVSKIIKYGLVMSVASLSSLGLRYIDTIFVGKFLTLSMVAIYSVAALIPTIIEAPLVALEKITSPKIADAWARKNIDEIKRIYYDSSLYLLLIGGLIFIGVNINIHDLFKIIPKDYSFGINVVFMLSLSTMFNMATGVNNSVIYNSEYYRYGVGLLYLLIIFTVITNLIFIPLYGLEGAALATMISGFLYNLLKFIFIRKKFQMNPFNKQSILLLMIIIVVLVLGFVIPSTKNGFANILIRSGIVTIVYLLLVYYMRIAPELFLMVRDFLKGKPGFNNLFNNQIKK